MYNEKRVVPKESNECHIESIHNKFDVVVKNIKTGEEQTYLAENVVTNVAWKDYIFKKEAKALRVGSSTEPEDPSQTDLLATFSKAKGTSKITYDWYGKNGNSRTSSYFYATTECNGNTFAELGLVSEVLSPTVFNRAIMKDLNGNPITIEKTELMEITIYATIYVTIDLQPWQGLVSNSALFSLINNGNQSFSVWTPIASGALTSDYKIEPGKLTKKSSRVQPANLNGGVNRVQSFGIMNDLFRSPTLYDITNRPLATGDGNTTGFHTGYFCEDITLYKNGTVVPKSEYRFNKYGFSGAYTYNNESYVNVNPFLVNIYNVRMYSSYTGNENLDEILISPHEDLPIDAVWWYVRYGRTGICRGSWDNGDTWEEVARRVGVYNNYRETFEKFSKSTNMVKIENIWETHKDSYYRLLSKGETQIVFNEPPESGAILTYSCKTPLIPKDENYVMEMSTYLTYVDPTV